MKDRDTETEDAEKVTEDIAKDTRDGGHIIDVECGLNRAVLHIDKLCQGSKGACILFEKTWMTPNEFQAASGRETAKDWKRSIKHHDKSLKLLMIKDILSMEPATCSCDYCTGTEPQPSTPPPQTSAVRKETRKKRAPADNDETKGVIRLQAKRGRKKRKKAKPASPVARQLRRRYTPITRRTITRASQRTSTRAASKAGHRTIDTSSDGTKESSESGTEKSDSESDEKEVESSSDEEEESLPLADVKKGLGAPAKGKKAATGCDDVAPVVAGKRKVGRKAATKAESPRNDDASAPASDITRDVTSEAKTNSAEKNVDEPNACETKCAETVEGDSKVESRAMHSNDACADIGKATQDASESHHVKKKSSLSETDVVNDSTSQVDAGNSMTPKIESATVESETTQCSNGTESKTEPRSASLDENDVIAPGVQHSAQTENTKVEKGQSRIGYNAPGDVVLEAPAAAPQANKRIKDTEPANGNTAVATTAAIPTPNDSDSAISTEDGNARNNASLPKEEHNVAANNNLAPTEDLTRASTDDVTRQDGADDDGELPSPKREARLLSIIQELKTYKKRLVTKIEAKKRTSDAGQSPLRDDDSPCPSDATKEETDVCPLNSRGCTPVTLDCTSQAIPPASSSPLQQLLFDPSVHPLSSVAQPLTGTTSRVPGKRRRNGNQRQVSYSTPGEGLLTARSTALNHAVNCNGVAVNGPPSAVVAYCFDSPAPTAGVIRAEQSALMPGRLPGFAGARSNDVANRGIDDKCLLKIPKRCNTNIAPGSARDHSATIPLLDLTAQKRKSSWALSEVAAKKQRGSWSIPMQGNVNVSMNSTNNSFLTSVSGIPSAIAVPLCDGARTGKTRSDPIMASAWKVAAAGYNSKSSRRPHISSWTADDVFAFVLSTPHASIYAKEFMEHRITGRVLQNLTAIQMMRILRIGEHAARAVRATVEKLLEITPALTQGVRR